MSLGRFQVWNQGRLREGVIIFDTCQGFVEAIVDSVHLVISLHPLLVVSTHDDGAAKEPRAEERDDENDPSGDDNPTPPCHMGDKEENIGDDCQGGE